MNETLSVEDKTKWSLAKEKTKYVKGFDGTIPVLHQSPAVLQIRLQSTEAHMLQHHSCSKANIQLECPC